MNRADGPWIGVPPRWRHRSDPDHGLLVSAIAPNTPGSGFVPSVTMTFEPVPWATLEDWQEPAERLLARSLVDLDVEEDDDYDLEGEPVHYRRVAHLGDLHDLISEQWCWLIDGVGYTLTGTVAREDYLDYCEVFEGIASTFQPFGRREVRSA